MHSFSQIEVKESRNASSLSPMELVLIISDLDLLFAMVSGHVCANVTQDALRLSGLFRYLSPVRHGVLIS